MRRQRSRLLITLLSVSLLVTQVDSAAGEGPAPTAQPFPTANLSPAAGLPRGSQQPPLASPGFVTNLLLGLTSASVKANGEEGGWPRTNANDGNDGTHWSGLPGQGSVANSWWAADVGFAATALGYRIYTYNPDEGGVAEDVASEVRIYGTDSASAWTALVDGSGKMLSDPAANGWTLVATQTNALVEPMDSGQVSFGAATTHRYWLFKAISGGPSEWDVNEFALGSGIPTAQTFGNGGRHANNPTRLEGEPVNTATGNYVSQVTDLALPGRGVGLAFTRTYNSLDPSVGPLGPGWTHSYTTHLTIGLDASARLFAEDGAQLLFAPDGAGGFLRPAGAYDSLIKLGDGSYQLTRRDQLRYHFDSSGLLLSETDRNGNALTFGYITGRLTTITDSVGRSVTLGYDGSGRLASLGAPLSRTVSYTYDAGGRLATVTDLRGGVTRYTYDAAGRLATIVDANNRTVVSNEYGADGRVSAQTDARGNRSTFAWNAAAQTSTFTDARGGAWVDVYAGNLLQSNRDPLGNTATYAYDANFNRSGVTDPRGNVTSFSYDPNSNLLSRTAPAPLSYVESWTYTARNDVASHTDGRGNTTTFAYDAAGNLVTMTEPGTAITGFGRDPAGSGLLVSLTDRRGKLTAHAYDAQANRTSTTSPLGERTTMSYDAAGRMTSLVEPRGNVTGANPADYTTTLAYDAADHLVSSRDPLGATTTQTYDPVGNLLTRTDPNGRATTRAYDAANHLVGVTDPAAKLTAYTYDVVGNLVTRTDANNHLTTYAYDLAKRLTSTTDALNHAWTLAYDPAGNPIARTDANAKTTTLAYDALNRLTGITYANGSTAPVTYAYDPNGNRTAMTDAAGTESFNYDALNRLLSDTRGSDVFTYTYDLAGNLLTRTYPDGRLTTYSYDDDARMATVSSPVTTSTTTLVPAADAYVKNTNPSTNYGTATSLLVKNDPATTIYRDYLRFDASTLSGTVSDAKLALTSVTSSSDASRHVCAGLVANSSWTETGVTWSNAPAIAGPNLACVTGNQSSGVAYNYDLGVAAGTNGSINLGLTQDTTTLTTYSSREGSNPPRLTVTTTNEPADHVAPNSPSGLSAGAVSGSEVDLAWTPATDNLGVQSYRISRNGSVVASVASPSFADTGLAAITAYTYTVSAVDAAGNLSAASSSAAATTLAANTYLVRPTADAYVKNTNPATNYGTDTTLLVKNDTAGTVDRTFFKFSVPTLAGTVSAASLRLYSATNSSDANRRVCAYTVSNTTWTETGITWSNAPTIGSPSLSCVVGNQPVGWVSYGLGSAISAPGSYAFAVTQDTVTLTTYTSREGTNPPQLLLTVTPVADTTAPSTPTGVTATAVNSRRVSVSWSAASDNVAVTRYLVYRGGVLVGQVAGSVTSLSDSSVVPASSSSYTVLAADAAGNQSAASSAAPVSVPGLVTTYTYDPAGNVLTAATPDGVTARSTYDRAGRLLEVAHSEAGGTLSRFTYGYDPAGNRTELTTVVGTTYYGYDALDRLTSACSGGSCVPPGGLPLACLACVSATIPRPTATISPNPSDTLTSFAYDPVGNRSSMITYLGTTTSTYDPADRLTSSSGPGASTYTYDANGNQLSAGATTYTYDLADRIVSATVGATTETYTWSGDGIRRSAATGPGAATTTFLVDRSFGLPEVAVVRDGSGTLLRDAIYGLGRISVVDAAGGIAYEHTDALGSVTDRTSSSGISLAWSEYAPYGAIRSAGTLSGVPADPFGFTGQYRDAATGLYHLRARQYDPTTGRLLSTDPEAASIGDPYVGSYVYVSNRPTVAADPSGRCLALIPAGAAAGAEFLGTAGTLVEPGGGTFAGLGIGALIGGVAGALACGGALVVAAFAGHEVGAALSDATRSDQPIYDPRQDPETQKRALELLRRTFDEVGNLRPGGPLPGGCRNNLARCLVAYGAGAALIIATIAAGTRGSTVDEDAYYRCDPKRC